MIIIVCAVLLGIALGMLGYFFSKTAYSLFTLALGSFGFFAAFLGLSMPEEIDSEMSARGLFDDMYQVIDAMGHLPTHIQQAIVLFIVTFFLARIGTWLFTRLYTKPQLVETKAERRQRIYASHGMQDPLA